MKSQKRITSAGLSINDPVDINAVGEQAIISPAIKKQSLDDLLAISPAGSFDLTHEDQQWLNTPAVGNEII